MGWWGSGILGEGKERVKKGGVVEEGGGDFSYLNSTWLSTIPRDTKSPLPSSF